MRAVQLSYVKKKKGNQLSVEEREATEIGRESCCSRGRYAAQAGSVLRRRTDVHAASNDETGRLCGERVGREGCRRNHVAEPGTQQEYSNVVPRATVSHAETRRQARITARNKRSHDALSHAAHAARCAAPSANGTCSRRALVAQSPRVEAPTANVRAFAPNRV